MVGLLAWPTKVLKLPKLVPGGLFANYYDQGGMTYVAHTTDAETFAYDWLQRLGQLARNYTFAKNIVGTVAYYDTENKVKEDEKSHIVWADLTFTF